MGVLHLPRRTTRNMTRLRQIIFISVLCLALYCLFQVPGESLDGSRWTNPEAYQARPRVLSPDLLSNRFLTESQCRATFPGLLDQVDQEVAKGPFEVKRKPNNLGPMIARIRDGQLYILSAARKTDLSKDMLAHRSATLHQISNALLTWPRPPSSSSSSSTSPFSHIPNTIFAFNHHDDPLPSTMSYSKPADPALLTYQDGSPRRFFPVPHFSFYSWALPFIGSLPRAARAISSIETTLSFSEKIPKAVWRGTTWFNNPRAGRLRQNLVRAFGNAKGKPWTDIEALDWTTTTTTTTTGSNDGKTTMVGAGMGERNASNALRIEDFCRYKYIIHTEGITYSGRFQFHNLCASVVVTPPVAWMQHLTHLLRPVFSHTLEGSRPRSPIDLGEKETQKSLAPYPQPWLQSAWPVAYDASEANIVFVAPDWSDLEQTIEWLEAHPQVAEGIARRQRMLFEDGGYFSPAAEMCYWRALIKGWSEVVRVEDGAFDDLEEVTWEEFSLKEIHK
ncbi:hypothetical protein GGS20DRAFT_35243 [Poronia punctata]|nr:hypothetical protein GGS20DRAFT_35243 [Poronia punctata]